MAWSWCAGNCWIWKRKKYLATQELKCWPLARDSHFESRKLYNMTRWSRRVTILWKAFIPDNKVNLHRNKMKGIMQECVSVVHWLSTKKIKKVTIKIIVKGHEWMAAGNIGPLDHYKRKTCTETKERKCRWRRHWVLSGTAETELVPCFAFAVAFQDAWMLAVTHSLDTSLQRQGKLRIQLVSPGREPRQRKVFHKRIQEKRNMVSWETRTPTS